MKGIKNFFSKSINLTIFITCIVIIAYFGTLIVKEISFKSYDQKRIECLKLGSDFARKKCLLIIESKKTNQKIETPTPIYSKEEFDRKIDELQK